MKRLIIILLGWVVALCSVFAQKKLDIPFTERANLELPRIKVVPIKDRRANRQYELFIKLPEGYDESKAVKHPVIYYTDAVWHVEMLSAAAEYIMEDAILVGISWQKDFDKKSLIEVGEFVSRYRDYTINPSTDKEDQKKYNFGGADDHLRFLQKDVFPYVEGQFKVDAGQRTYFGYSTGGLFGAYILAEQPQAFKNYIIGSPALWSDASELVDIAGDKAMNVNVFISTGTEEVERAKSVQLFVDGLKKHKELNIKYEVLKGDHQTAFPRISVRSIGWLTDLSNGSDTSLGTNEMINDDPDFPLLAGPYMGQKPPGMVAEPFALGIICKEGWELEGVFAPGMKEFYFTRDKGAYTTFDRDNFKPSVIGFRQVNNVWKKFIEFPRQGEIVFSPDGQRMYMADGYKDREGDGWSERKSLGPMFAREDWGIMRLSVSDKGTYVFDDYKNDDVIRISTVIDGQRQEPILMDYAVNSGEWTAHPFIAPDESYLIWDSEREDGFGDSDLYIRFKQEDGSWGPAINMGEGINSPGWDAYASVTPDGKYILFNRQDNPGDLTIDNNTEIYWVDASIIEKLRP